MLNNIYDSFFKSLFSVRENLQDLIHGTLPGQILSQVNIDSLEFDPTEYIDQNMASHFRDICCNMEYGDERIKISLIYEHKSHPVKHIHLQLLQYILNVWDSQTENKQELTPVICIVFYHGKSRWFRFDILKNVSDELRPYVPMFDYVLFDTSVVEDQKIMELFRSRDVMIGVWLLKRSHNLMDFMQDNILLAREIFKDFQNINQGNIQRIMLFLYNASGKDPEETNKIMKTISLEAGDPMYKFHNKLIEESIEQGIEQGVLKTAEKMISKGYSDEQVAEITSLEIKQIRLLRRESL